MTKETKRQLILRYTREFKEVLNKPKNYTLFYFQKMQDFDVYKNFIKLCNDKVYKI